MTRIADTLTADSGSSGPGFPKLFTVGTLAYTKRGLWMLFFWLM